MGVVRIIIGLIFLECSITVIKKSKAIRKRMLYGVFTCVSIALVTVLGLLPFENLFITFSSPNVAYEYFTCSKSNIELVVEGNNCDFIIDRNNGTETRFMIPKTVDGWKLGTGLDTKNTVRKETNGITTYVYQYRNTNDYFIIIFDTNGGESIVSDEYNTTFYSLEEYNDSLGKTFVTYYAHIPNFNAQYSVTVNGNKIALGS